MFSIIKFNFCLFPFCQNHRLHGISARIRFLLVTTLIFAIILFVGRAIATNDSYTIYGINRGSVWWGGAKHQTERINDEASYQQRIEKPILKVLYSFGMPPHRADRDIVDLGEFPMEMRQFMPLQEE